MKNLLFIISAFMITQTQASLDETADRLQFEEEKMDPFKKVQYMQSLLQGLPLETQAYTYSQPTKFDQFVSDTGSITDLLTDVFGMFK